MSQRNARATRSNGSYRTNNRTTARTAVSNTSTERYQRRRRRNVKYKKQKSFNWRYLWYILIGVIIYFTIKLTLDSGIIDKSAKYINSVVTGERVIEEPRFLQGISIGGVDVSNLTLEEAEKLLISKINTELEGNAVTVKSNDGTKVYTYSLEDFGVYYNIEAALKSAMGFGSVEEEWISDYKQLQNGMVDFPVYFYDIGKIQSYVNAIAKENNIESKNAQCDRIDGKFKITEAVVGYKMDSRALYNQIIDLMDAKSFNTELLFELHTEQPKYFAKDFAYIDNELSSFSSSFTGGDKNRIQNLKNGCEKIDGTIIYPDEVFSTNEKFNPCTEANGWANAGTIVNGKIEDSIGGGMCQVSSVLYDAALYAELEIVERHNHSLKVGYSKYAFDATLSGDYLDLKFKNNTGYPLYLQSYISGSKVIVKFYGYDRFAGTGREIKLENKFVEETQPGEPIVKYDPELPEGTENIEVTALAGQKYELYKKVYINGKLTETVKINTSTYKPRREEKVVGQKKSEEATEITTQATNVIEEPVVN